MSLSLILQIKVLMYILLTKIIKRNLTLLNALKCTRIIFLFLCLCNKTCIVLQRRIDISNAYMQTYTVFVLKKKFASKTNYNKCYFIMSL